MKKQVEDKKLRVEKHIIKDSHSYFKLIDEFCFMSKNLYNFANYQVRQEFIANKKYLNYNEIEKLVKIKDSDFDYRNMPTAQSAQQTLKLLDKNWQSFFASVKDYKKNPNKYTGRPKLPKYLKKNGRNILVLTNQNCKIKDGYIQFPKVFNGFKFKTKQNNLQQVRILPRNKYLIIEVIYKSETCEQIQDNGRYCSIDIGIDNFATITNNIGKTPIIINGKSLKSMNQYYNKQMAHYKEVAKRMNELDYTNRQHSLTIKRNNRINDFIHKASSKIIELALDNGISKIIVGNNRDWKRESKLSKKVNQNFVGIPHQAFINKLIYKGKDLGMEVILAEESYTSGTSFLDNEYPVKANYNKSRRKFRGLFISNQGIKINADTNGSYQILKKVFPNAYSNGIVGVGLHPIVVNVA
jgi:putative transposase